MTIVYILLGTLVITNTGVLYLYFKEKQQNDKVVKDTTACQITIESLRQTIKHISEEFYSLDKLIDSRIQAHVNRLNEVIEDTMLVESPTVDDKYIDNMNEEKVRELFDNPFPEKSLSHDDILRLYPEFKNKNLEKNGISGKLPGVIEGNSITFERGVQQ